MWAAKLWCVGVIKNAPGRGNHKFTMFNAHRLFGCSDSCGSISYIGNRPKINIRLGVQIKILIKLGRLVRLQQETVSLINRSKGLWVARASRSRPPYPSGCSWTTSPWRRPVVTPCSTSRVLQPSPWGLLSSQVFSPARQKMGFNEAPGNSGERIPATCLVGQETHLDLGPPGLYSLYSGHL